MVNFLNMDNIEFMKTKPDKYYDLAIVDPPYGIDIAKTGVVGANGTDYGAKDWDQASPPPEYFTELMRVSKNQIIFGANHFISKIPFDSSCWIVWDKSNSTSKFADCELAWTSFDTAVRKFKWRWNGFMQENMKNKQKRIHPTEKPIQLYRWIMMNYAEPGWKILDTHGGSMSISIAADQEKFDLDVCEIDPDYFNKGVKQFEVHKSQLELF